MNRRQLSVAALALPVAAGLSGVAQAKGPTEWDGLIRVKSKRFDYVFLQSGADFRPYTKVMLDPTEVGFEKDWRRDYNNSTRDLSQRVSERDIQKLIVEGVKAATDLFAEACQEGGYPVVDAEGPDVLRLRTGVANIRVSAPDRPTMGRSYTFADEAGSAQLIVEVRDSLTGAIMGRAVDGKVIGDTTVGLRNSVTNRADFRRVVKGWASASVRGLNELKALSPIDPSSMAQR